MSERRNNFIDSLRERGDIPPIKVEPKDPYEVLLNKNKTEVNNNKEEKRTISKSSEKYTESKLKEPNKKIRRIAALLAAGAIFVGGLVAHNAAQKNEYNKECAFDLEGSIVSDTYNNLHENEDRPFTYNEENKTFIYEQNCTRPNLYKVLSQTDIDEILNSYISDGSRNLEEVLKERVADINNFNVALLKASLADSLGIDMEDVEIKVGFFGNSNEEKEEIINGNKQYVGHRLTIASPETPSLEAQTKTNIKYNQTPDNLYNYDEINEILFDIISDIKMAEVAPNARYSNEDILTRAISNYKNLKCIINEHDLSIKDGKLVIIDAEGKEYNIEKERYGYDFEEVNNRKIEDEERT